MKEIKKSKSQINDNSQRILIKDDAFIGARSIILKGVTIGNGAVIGAGSVVSYHV